MDGTATLTVTPAGLHLRLSSRGYTIYSLHRFAVPDETPTVTATRTLAEHGWHVSDWQQERTGTCAVWTAVLTDTTAAVTGE